MSEKYNAEVAELADAQVSEACRETCGGSSPLLGIKFMKIGIIDLGANSLRFDIYEISRSGNISLLYRHRDMIRIGDQVFTRHKFSRAAIQRLLKTLKHVKEIAQKNNVEHMVCYGTSPFREARNTASLIQKIKKEVGLKISILSGRKEAKLISQGILHFHPTTKLTVLIDIGGGSTEITMIQKQKVIFSKSLPLGSMRLQHAYLRRIPPSQKAVHHLRSIIQSTLKNYIPHQPISFAIGSGGTLKALLKTSDSKKNVLSRQALENFCQKIGKLKLSQLKTLLKTEGQRGDIILAGTILTLEILSFFHLNSIYVSQRGLRDGILLDILKKYGKEES